MPLEMRESDAFKGAETKRSSSISSVVFGNFVLFLPKFFPSRFFQELKPLLGWGVFKDREIERCAWDSGKQLTLVRSSCKPIIRRFLKMVPVRAPSGALRACINTYKSALKEKSWSLVALHLWIRSTTWNHLPNLASQIDQVYFPHFVRWVEGGMTRYRRNLKQAFRGWKGIKSSKQLMKKPCGPWKPFFCLKMAPPPAEENQPWFQGQKAVAKASKLDKAKKSLKIDIAYLASRTALSLKEWSFDVEQ